MWRPRSALSRCVDAHELRQHKFSFIHTAKLATSFKTRHWWFKHIRWHIPWLCNFAAVSALAPAIPLTCDRIGWAFLFAVVYTNCKLRWLYTAAYDQSWCYWSNKVQQLWKSNIKLSRVMLAHQILQNLSWPNLKSRILFLLPVSLPWFFMPYWQLVTVRQSSDNVAAIQNPRCSCSPSS